jgi:hypothetical protein
MPRDTDSVFGTLSENQTNGRTTGSPIDPAPNPLDLKSLRRDQNFAANVGVKKVLTTIPVRKPHSQEWFRVRPGEDWRINLLILKNKNDGESYIVSPELRGEVATDLVLVVLLLWVNRQSDAFLWDARLPGPDGRTNPWNESALDGAKRAETEWTKISANMLDGYYDVGCALNKNLPEPVWPELSFQEIINLAFSKRTINSADHPVLRLLRGEI